MLATLKIINHSQALVIFWISVVLMGNGWILFFVFGEALAQEADACNCTPDFAWVLLGLNIMAFPVIVMVPLIGSGYFEKKRLQL